MQRKESFVAGEFYHLYNRGNSKQKIFLDDHDRNRFIKLLYLCNSKKRLNFREINRRKISIWEFDRGNPIVSIGAWVLMPNHFHILITPNSSQTPSIGQNSASFFMRKLCVAYSKYFNTKYKRTGGLFETNFKSSLIDSDPYAKYIFSYIHLNPIKLIDPTWKEKGIKNIKESQNFLNGYDWSSYIDYCGVKREEAKILSQKDFPEYFRSIQKFNEEIMDWLSFGEEIMNSPTLPTPDVGRIVGI